MRYLLDRLREPGTLRSLAVVVFALKGIVPDEALLQNLVNIGILAGMNAVSSRIKIVGAQTKSDLPAGCHAVFELRRERQAVAIVENELPVSHFGICSFSYMNWR